MPSRRAACAARSFRAAAMTACSQLCRSATDVLSVISFPAACGSLDREDSLKDGNLHRISSPRSCGASSEESETSPARPNMHASRPRPTGPPRHQKFLSPFRQNATCVASRDPQAAKTAQPFLPKRTNRMAYSPTVKLQQQESSRGRDERPAHSYDDIAPGHQRHSPGVLHREPVPFPLSPGHTGDV